jgi:hypothetical protein
VSALHCTYFYQWLDAVDVESNPVFVLVSYDVILELSFRPFCDSHPDITQETRRLSARLGLDHYVVVSGPLPSGHAACILGQGRIQSSLRRSQVVLFDHGHIGH